MTVSTVSTQGRVLIPKEIRQKYGLKAGTKVRFVDYRGSVYLIPIPDDPITAMHGMLAGGPSLTADLLAERERDLAREEEKFRSFSSE